MAIAALRSPRHRDVAQARSRGHFQTMSAPARALDARARGIVALARHIGRGAGMSISMDQTDEDRSRRAAPISSTSPHAPWLRLPGLFRLREIVPLTDLGEEYSVDGAGRASDGEPLFAVHCRSASSEDGTL